MQTREQYSTGDGKLRRLTLVEGTVLPASLHALVEARVTKRVLVPGDLPDWGMMSPTRQSIQQHGVVAGRALIDGRSPTVMVPVLNPTDSMTAFMAPVAAVGCHALTDQGAQEAPNVGEEHPHSVNRLETDLAGDASDRVGEDLTNIEQLDDGRL